MRGIWGDAERALYTVFVPHQNQQRNITRGEHTQTTSRPRKTPSVKEPLTLNSEGIAQR